MKGIISNRRHLFVPHCNEAFALSLQITRVCLPLSWFNLRCWNTFQLPAFYFANEFAGSFSLLLCLNLRRSRNCKSVRKISNEKYTLSAEVRLNSFIFHVCPRSKIRRSETPRFRRKISDWKILLKLNWKVLQNLETSIFEIITNDWCL